MSRTLGRRTGERKQHVLELTEQAGKLAARSIAEARRLATVARRRARGRGAKAKLRQIQRLEQFIDRAQRVCEQIRMRLRGEPITDRLVSIFDPDARPPQGQARQAQRVRVRHADLRGHREHQARRDAG